MAPKQTDTAMKASLLPALEQEPTEQIQFWPSAEIRVSLLHYQSQEEQAWAQHGSNVQWEAHSSASFTLNNSVTNKHLLVLADTHLPLYLAQLVSLDLLPEGRVKEQGGGTVVNQA